MITKSGAICTPVSFSPVSSICSLRPEKPKSYQRNVEKSRQRCSRPFADLWAHRRVAFRDVRAHIFHVRCARQTTVSPFGIYQAMRGLLLDGPFGKTRARFFEHSLALWCQCLVELLFAMRSGLFNSPSFEKREFPYWRDGRQSGLGPGNPRQAVAVSYDRICPRIGCR